MGRRAIKYAYRSDVVYSGYWRDRGPDIILGYDAGWRGSNESALGEVPPQVFVDNEQKWSGDHCMAASICPGVFFANREIQRSDPNLCDLTATILDVFGAPTPACMQGRTLGLMT